MSEEVSEEEVSLPDQLPIITESCSTESDEPLHKVHSLRGSTIKQRRSTKLNDVLKPKQSIIPRYFTSSKTATDNIARDFKKEISPFEYPRDIELFAHAVMTKAWRDDKRIRELQNKVHNRPNYRGRQKRDSLNRLYVEKPVITEGKTVLNMDPNYYTVVGGKPIRNKLDIREYIQTVRESLRTKIVTGFREDDILLIDEELKLEQKVIDTIRENLQQYINIFEQFLIIDHRTAMNLLQQSETSATAGYAKYMEHNAVAKKFANLHSSLYNVEQKWKQCKTYQKFLYAVSPLTWRMEQDCPKNRRTSIYMLQQRPGDASDIYANYRLSLAERGLSLQDIIQEFREEIAGEKDAALYFTEPEQLLDVLKFIEMQNLNSLLHSEGLAVPLENVKEGMKTAVTLFDNQIKKLEEIIEQLEGGISWEEQRVIYLEELAVKLIKTELKNVIIDESILNLHVFVEDIYEAILGPNDANLSLWEMMKAVEESYRHELLLMDKVPSVQVAQLEGSYYKEEMLVMKLAERASKQHDELEKITVNLNKAYTPPAGTAFIRRPKNRSPPLKQPLKEEEPPLHLTAEEGEFLEFFTEFCEYTDNPGNYGIQRFSQDATNNKTKKLAEEAAKNVTFE
ncbi:cilia- and flagella-associated protein 100-like [Anoplophora glabripennis]|uniref:cilia- and flagella-associated protein 100-like n=1 Tax=Anoplophora glabripennis TaxID=217634 RepID=UPI000C762CB3|nr:cilia- and flagella-associated protein 100-like [Anoplophora glabripennis]